jgi:hypothetical protein
VIHLEHVHKILCGTVGRIEIRWQSAWYNLGGWRWAFAPLVADQILGATSPTKESPASDHAGKEVSSRLPELLEANALLWQKEQGYLYTDNDSSAGKYLEVIAQHFGAWSVSYNKWTGPLETRRRNCRSWRGRRRRTCAGATGANTPRSMRGSASWAARAPWATHLVRREALARSLIERPY